MSLNASLSIAVQALGAAEGAIQVTNNNIANAKTPGYSRQIVLLTEAAPSSDGNLTLGNGVLLQGFQSVRNELLQMRIEQETTAQSGANAQLTTLQQIQPTFTTSTQDIGTQMSALFASLSSLSASPANSSSRQSVITAGQNLTNAFNSASNTLTSLQTGLNTQITQDVNQINTLTSEIAALNPEILNVKASGQDTGSLQDQQDQFVLQLSSLTNVTVGQSASGMTVSTGTGTVLVAGALSNPLTVATGGAGTTGMTDVFDSSGTDITTSLTSGDLGGTIVTRDKIIPDLLNKLNTLANQFAAAMNLAQTGTLTTGVKVWNTYDQNGNPGKDLFTSSDGLPITAATIAMTTDPTTKITDPAWIAASSDGSAGSNGNLVHFADVQMKPLVVGGQTPTQAYSALVFNVGSLTANQTAESSATTSSLLQLNDQRNSISGVSIDQESANLIQFQQAYQAAARIVTTLQTLFQATINMVN